MVPMYPLPGEGSGLLVEGLSIPKDDIRILKSWSTSGPPFHRLTHNLGPCQAGAAGCGVCGACPSPGQLLPNILLFSHWMPLRSSSAAQTPATRGG